MSGTDSHSASRMGTAPMGPLLFSLALPMMVSMLFQALYNVVDSIFVSYVSEAALSAVSLAFPIQNLMIAFAVGTGVGVNAYVSKSLGEGNRSEADRAAANGLFLALCTFVVFFLFGVFGVEAFMHSQTEDAAIRQYGVDYLAICCLFSLGCMIQCMVEKLLSATGRSNYAMITQLVGALTNIVMDPILIFGLFGFPRMEAAGAAAATVAGQFLGAFTGLYLNLRHNHDIQFRLRDFRPHGRTVRRIYQVGIPSIAMTSVGSVMTFCMNRILIAFSSTAVAVFGVYFKMQSFIVMPLIGLNNGMVPIIAYNYGARKPQRIVKVVKMSVVAAVAIMLLGFAAAQLCPGVLLSIFNAGPDMLALGEVALRIISVHFIIAGFNIVASAVFQALGRGVMALLVSLVRQLFVLVPAAWLLSLSGNVNLIWWAFPIAEVSSLIMCSLFLTHCYRTVVRPMLEQTPAVV